jgi:hypothetical protein
VKKGPFTIQLLYATTDYVQDLTMGIDPGSTTAGFAVVEPTKGAVKLRSYLAPGCYQKYAKIWMKGRCIERIGENHLPVAYGRFGTHMQVTLVNDGPVTITLEKKSPLTSLGFPTKILVLRLMPLFGFRALALPGTP